MMIGQKFYYAETETSLWEECPVLYIEMYRQAKFLHIIRSFN